MLANFLNKSKPINFIGLLIFFFVSFLFNVFDNGLFSDKILQTTYFSLLFLVIFFIYNFIINKNKLTHDNSYAFYVFILLNISILSELGNYKIISLTIIYLLFIRKIYSLRSPKKILEKLFDSGFWLGVFFILEPLSILLFLLIYIACYLHSKITIHTLLAPIIGFITPLILYFTYFFWVDKTEEFTKLFYFDEIFNIQFYSEAKYLWLTGCLFLFSICTILIKSITILSVNNTFKKSWILLIYNLVVLTLFTLSLPQKNGSELTFILFPISVILANGIELIQKKAIKNLALYLILIGSILMNYIL